MNIIKEAQGFLDQAPPSDKPAPVSTLAPAQQKTNAPTGNSTQSAPAVKTDISTPKSSAPIVHVAPSNPSVLKMQNEMLKLRNEFFTTKITNTNGTSPAWNNFATSMFQRHLDHNGSKKSEPFIDKIESIKLIGKSIKSPKGENVYKADGSWGKNTNAALLNIKDLGNMMISIAGKFQIMLDFNAKDMDKLKSLIPSDPSQMSKINETANEITEILERMTNSVERFITSIESNMVQNREKSELSAEYDKEKQTKEESMAKFPGAATIQLNSKNFKNGLNLSNLLTPEALIQFITANKLEVDTTDNKSLLNFISSLEDGIKNGTITVSKLTPSEIF